MNLTADFLSIELTSAELDVKGAVQEMEAEVEQVHGLTNKITLTLI